MKKNRLAAKTPVIRDGIREFIQSQPRSTIADVARFMGKGRTTARHHLDAMVNDGTLTRDASGKYSVAK